MECNRISSNGIIAHVCGPEMRYVMLKGKRYYFDWHDYLGVTIINQKTFEPTKAQKPPPGFWGKFDKWLERRK